MEENHIRAVSFIERGFKNVIVSRREGYLRCRTNVHNEDELKTWKELYCMTSRTSVNAVKTRVPANSSRLEFCQRLICQFGNKRHKGIKKHFTGCAFQMQIQIKKVTERKVKRDKLLKTHPCFITIRGKHNHSDDPKALKELPILPGIKDDFVEYFKRGMGIAAAQKYHRLKMDLSDDCYGDQTRGDINPSLRAIYYMFDKWFRTDGQHYSHENMFEALNNFSAKSKSVIEVERSEDGSFCVALVTPFMKRVHKLREASEVVLVDVVTSVDQPDTRVVPFHCSSPAGILPLGVVFLSSQDEARLIAGFRLLRKALGDSAFGGRGHPVAFITDNSCSEKNALRAVWPRAAQFVSVTHVLRQTWRWLLDSENRVPQEKRHELIDVIRRLASAESPESLNDIMDKLDVNHDGFASYLANLFKDRAEWAVAFRQGALHRSHHASNQAAATLCVMRDIAQNRWKTKTAYELVIIVDDIYNGFMLHRLIDFALDLRQTQRLAPLSVPASAITRIDELNFRVADDGDHSATYDVALDLGVCSCEVGASGGLCTHQAACAYVAMASLPQAFLPTPENRHWLMCVAVGEDKAPNLGFFTDFRASGSSHVRRDSPASGDADTSSGNVAADNDSVRSAESEPDSSGVDEPPDQLTRTKEVTRPASPLSPVQTRDPASHPPSGSGRSVESASQPEPLARGRRPAAHIVAKFHDAVDRSLELLGEGLSDETLQKATDMVASLTSSAQLHDWLTSAGSSAEIARRGAAERRDAVPTPLLILFRPEPQEAHRVENIRPLTSSTIQVAKRQRTS